MSHLAEVYGGHVVVLAARHPVDERQHLILGLDELGLVGAGGDKKRQAVNT